jgi:hypothetical protein
MAMVPSLLCVFPMAKCLFKHNNPSVEYAKDTMFVDSREFGRWTINLHPTSLEVEALALVLRVHDLLRPSQPTSYNPQAHNNYRFKMHFRTRTIFCKYTQAFSLFESRKLYSRSHLLLSLFLLCSLCVSTSKTMMFLNRTNNKLKDLQIRVHPAISNLICILFHSLSSSVELLI